MYTIEFVKAEPISFRPSLSLDKRLDSLRDSTGIPKSQLVAMLADEAERTRRYPGVAFGGPDHRRRAQVIGTRLDVWEIVEAWQDFSKDGERAREYLGVTSKQMTLTLAYYREFPDEIDRALALTRRSSEEIALAYPFIEVHRIEE